MWLACGMRLYTDNIGLALEMGRRKVTSLNKHFHIQELGHLGKCSGHNPSSLVYRGNRIKTADGRLGGSVG